MIKRLPYDQERPARPRTNLDQRLEIGTWKMPGGAYRQRQVVPSAPGWWRGDEDASQTFLHAMGVVSLK